MVYPKSPPPDFLGTGWAFPLGAVGGRVGMRADAALVEQSIGLILSTAKGERVMEPDFGSDLPKLVFTEGEQAVPLAEHAVRAALERWEPRIKVLAVTASVSPTAPATLLIGIAYLLRAFNSRHNLVYPFYLG